MGLSELEQALNAFSVLSQAQAFPVHHAQVFLAVARGDEPTYQEIETRVGLTNSSVSRTLMALGALHRKGCTGMGLVATYQDPGNRRRFRARLTSRGRALLRQLEGISSQKQ